MFRVFGVVILTGVLSACAQMPQWSWSRGFANLDFTPRAQTFNFDWQLSGDPQIAPLQVFDDGQRTWLQFATDQLPPALFRRTEHGDVLLKASRDGAYLVIEGAWPHVLVRGGHLVAHVRRLEPSSGMSADETVRDEPAAPDVAQAVPLALPVPQIESALEPASRPVSGPALEPAPALTPVVPPIPVIPDAEQDMSWGVVEFAVSPSDGNLRRALVRWAGEAGWTFGPEHWVVDVDVPLTAAATFGIDFKPAVRDLLAATELGDRPLQPCFYANKVLRVVPFAQRCDRSLAPGAV